MYNVYLALLIITYPYNTEPAELLIYDAIIANKKRVNAII